MNTASLSAPCCKMCHKITAHTLPELLLFTPLFSSKLALESVGQEDPKRVSRGHHTPCPPSHAPRPAPSSPQLPFSLA